MSKPKVGSYWTHKKTGRDYKILCVGLWEETLEKCVVYFSEDNNKDLVKYSWMDDLRRWNRWVDL